MEEVGQLMIRILGDGTSYAAMLHAATGDTLAFGDAIRNIGTQAQSVIATLASGLGIDGFVGTVQNMIGKAAETESIEIAFRSLTGSVEKAQTALAELRQFAVDTPFEVPQILQAAKMMMAYGQSSESIVPTMHMLGDVTSALGLNMKDVARVYGSLRTQHRVFTRDMTQFSLRGIPIWEELGAVMGLTKKGTDQLSASQRMLLQEMVTSGQITFPQIEKAFQNMTGAGGRFYNVMKDQSATFLGQLSNLKDSMGLLFADVGKEIIEGLDLKRIIGEIRNGAQGMVDAFKTMDSDTKKLLFNLLGAASAAAGLVASFNSLSSIIGTAVSLLGPWGILVVIIGAAIGLWIDHIGGVGAALDIVRQKGQEFWEWLGPIREALGSLFDELVRQGRLAWIQIQTWAAQAWEWIRTTFNINFTDIRDAIADGILFMEFSITNFAKVWAFTWASIKLGSIVALNYILDNLFVILAGPVIVGYLAIMLVNWRALWDNMLAYASKALTALLGSLKTIAKNLGKIITGDIKLTDLFKFNMDDFRGQAFAAGIQIPALKELEARWRKDWEDSGAALNMSFEDWKKDRKKNLAEAGGGWADIYKWLKKKPIPPPIDDKAWKAAKDTVKGMDAVLFGSTEALSRILAYREHLFPTTTAGGMPGMLPPPVMPGGFVPPQAPLPMRPVNANDPAGGGMAVADATTHTWLSKIHTALEKKPNVEPANFDG